MSAMEQVLSQALELSLQERAAVAHRLLLSLDDGEPDPDYEEAWQAELEARLAKTENADFVARDAHEVIADIRKSLPKRTKS